METYLDEFQKPEDQLSKLFALAVKAGEKPRRAFQVWSAGQRKSS
jgi:hypothetical protein